MTFRILATVSLLLCFSFLSVVAVAAQKTPDAPSTIEDYTQAKPFLGAAFERPSNKDAGLRVRLTLPGTPADSAGLQVDDILVAINGNEISSMEMLHATIGENKIGDKVELLLRRNKEELKVSVALGDRSDFITVQKQQDEEFEAAKPKPMRIDSEDELQITIDVYAPHTDNAPIIVLCHQAGWSRGEYREIAPKLNELGFNCYSVDQRSGGSVNEVLNETNKRAEEEGKGVAFLDAEQDMIAALKFVREETKASEGEQTVILWGSSYSAALALRIAGEHPELVDGVLAFAPGEYFKRFGKSADWIESSAQKIECPAFITSAKKELKNWKTIYDSIPGDSKMMFLPETDGNHGSRALWEEFDDHEAYWNATNEFLAQFSHGTKDQDGEHDHDENAKEKAHTHESGSDK